MQATETLPTAASPAAKPLTLDDLLAMDARALSRLYREASTPRLEDVAGDLEGRMLAPAFGGRGLASVLRPVSRSRLFPWRGKTFTTTGDDRGEGANRVVADRMKLFRFATSIAKSRAGDFDALELDYDRPGNPFPIRAVKDELRMVAPGLFLGQMYTSLRGRERLVLYFGLARRPSPVTSTS